MRINKINDTISVGPQISVDDVASLKGKGFNSLVVTRPEGEEPGQPAFDDLSAAATLAGLPFHQIPVFPGQISDENAATFKALFDALPKPVFAYCRSGTRAATLWALGEAENGTPVEQIIRQAGAAGYDLSAITPRLNAASKA